MENLRDAFFLTVFVSGILGFIVACILFFLNKTESYSSRLLAGFLVTFSALAINYSLMTSKFFTHVPHLWRVLGFASFCYSPLGYLYVRSVLQQRFKFQKADLWMFIPAVLHPLSLIPFFLKPVDEKIAFITRVYNEPSLVTLEPELLPPPGTFFILRVVMGVTAVTAQIILLYKWRKNNGQKMLEEPQNASTFRWLSQFTGLLTVHWSLVLFQIMYTHGHSIQLNYTLIITISITILFVSLYLMIKPSLLYGIKGWVQNKPTIMPSVTEQEEKEFKKYTLSEEQGLAIKRKVEDYFLDQKPYRKIGFTISDLSHAIQVPTYQLSSFINQQYAKNFNELINGYRVDYLISRRMTSNDFDQFTLEALSKDAGFNSRASFIAAVKKHTGKTPSELFRARGQLEVDPSDN